MRIVIASSLSLLVLSACGSTPAKDSPADEAKAATEAPKPWSALETPEEKGEFMQEVVTPTMAALLQAHSPERYAEVTCKTCHGQDPQSVGFKMPTPDLPPLNPADHFAEHQDHPTTLQFMIDVFTPKMAEVLGVEMYNPETNPQGFGCFACHTMKQMPEPIPSEPTEPTEAVEGGAVEASEVE